MASTINDPGGTKRIQFFDPGGNRRAIRLGKMSRRDADSFRLKLERLLSALSVGHAPDHEISIWLANLPSETYAKLVRVGLVPERESGGASENQILAFCGRYIEAKNDIKPRTRYLLQESLRELSRYLHSIRKPEMMLGEFTPGHAEELAQWLLGKGLGPNTVRRRCGRVRQFFRHAIRHRIILDNPFHGMNLEVTANESRQFFVSQEMAEKVLAVCGSPQWRALFALARYGGLRTPSEPLCIELEHVNWEEMTLYVSSPKTERHAGKESRLVPIFPELRPHLEEAWNEAYERGEKYLIWQYREQSVNLGTHLRRLIIRAGLQPWPKAWQNLRSSRETELVNDFPIQYVVAWLGNSQPVAMRHYLQKTSDVFQRAVQGGAKSGAAPARKGQNHVENT